MIRLEAECPKCVIRFRVKEHEFDVELDYDYNIVYVVCPICKQKYEITRTGRD